MLKNFDYLFQYLEKEDIFIDKSDFEFQMRSHPEFPSLLSVADTLEYFGIKNNIVHLSISDIELLPKRFVVLLSGLIDQVPINLLCLIEKRDGKYFDVSSKIPEEIDNKSIITRWQNVVLLIENQNVEEVKTIKNKFLWILPLLFGLTFLLILSLLRGNLESKLFFFFPIIGILFSIAALKNLFGVKNELIAGFCNITTSTNCSSIIDSNKWKIFKILNFSDLAVLFFASQLLGYFIFLLNGTLDLFFSIQKILLLSSIFVIFLSLYYQKFVEKKWCPICLIIIVIILSELSYIFLALKFSFEVTFLSIILLGFTFFGVSLVWSLLKSILIKNKELKEFQIKANRFIRNYKLFKNNLKESRKIEIFDSPIKLGNKECKIVITIITNPFCGYCKRVHEILDSILEKHYEEIQINLIIKTEIEKEIGANKLFFESLLEIYFKQGAEIFVKSLNEWFLNKNIDEWLQKFAIKEVYSIMKTNSIYHSKSDWCRSNGINYTPAIFINGYEYPDSYDRQDLPFFINDIIEDIDLA